MLKKTLSVTERHDKVLKDIKKNKGTKEAEMLRRILDEFCDKYEKETGRKF